jgi:hypothetical protein
MLKVIKTTTDKTLKKFNAAKLNLWHMYTAICFSFDQMLRQACIHSVKVQFVVKSDRLLYK